MSEDPIKAALGGRFGPATFVCMSRTQTETFTVAGERYDVLCCAGDTARIIEANLRCAVAARKASEAMASVKYEFQVKGEAKAIGDWKRPWAYVGWQRYAEGGDVHVNDNAEPGAFRVLVSGTLLGDRFWCPDAAREAADAYLVSQGRLPAARAFVRLGEWEEDSVSHFRTNDGVKCHHAYFVANKEIVDANLVASGLLDPSRAFKAPTEEPAKPTWGEWERRYGAFVRMPSDPGAMPVGAFADRWGRGLGIEKATDIDDAREKADAFLVARGELEAGRAFKRVGDWREAPDGSMWRQGVAATSGCVVDDAGKAAADAELVRRGLLAEERAFKVARPKLKPLAWDVGGGVTAVTGLAFGNAVPNTAVGIDYASAHGNTTTAVVVNKRADGVSEVVGYAQDITKMPDDEINAMYGKHSEVARAMIGAKRRETRTVVHAVTNHGGAVTLATWEHHLPTLLDNAPREFRDGFNRRQGPAWEAYLRGLAGVREEIQCRKLRGSPGVTEVVLMATTKAHIILGPYWIDANVVGKR